jgi:hypothetical protein
VFIGQPLLECAVDSFANKLLDVQRQAEPLLKQHCGLGDPNALQQSFLLRGGHFIGVCWEQGDWRAEWVFQANELSLRCSGQERQRVPLRDLAGSPPIESRERRAA